jgi:DNA-binding NarL/FixJ family response regulator
MNAPARTRLLLADDHRITLEVLRWSLRAAPELEIVGEAVDGPTAVRLAAELKPDIVIVDIALPGLDGVEVTRQIRNAGRGPRVVALSAYAERRLIRAMFRAGASGYVAKTGGMEDLVDAIRTVAAGGAYLGSAAAGADLARELATGDEPISARERDILRLIAAGRSMKEIAGELHLSAKTVENHRRNLMDNLGLGGTADLTRYAITEGIVPL